MRKLGILHVVFILLVIFVGMAVPYRTASAVGPTITDSTATPNMVSLFGDNMTPNRGSPFGPNWTTVVVKLSTTPTSVKAFVGTFFSDIMPLDARDRASSTAAWDAFITAQNNTSLSLTSGVWKTDIILENLFNGAAALFTPAVFRRMVEQELRTGQKSIAIVATDAGGTTPATVTVWVVDAQFMVRKGWNLRSTPIALADNTWGGILASGNKTSVIGVGLKFDPSKPVGSQWVILLASDTIFPLDGVYIYSSQDDALGGRLFRSASAVAQPAAKFLTRGAWNLVGTAPDFVDNFSVVTASNMRGLLSVSTALQSVSSGWVTAISPGEGDTTITSAYIYAGSTPANLALGSYNWKFGQPGWSFTNTVDTVNPTFATSSKGWTIPFGGYWVFIQSPMSGEAATITLSGKNQGTLTDEWMLKLLTLLP